MGGHLEVSQGPEGAGLRAAAAAVVAELFSRQAHLAAGVNLGGPAHTPGPVSFSIRGRVLE